ncbi:hypothetical protein [Actinomadura physcomitrii]|uniref:hypothetical protein n=1 Tax=Actinomadura physcomitrii TaxID=2650748 RepID=UPI0019232103|nr:hypothetical protein [Actinomadura physcomitrii]
MGRAGGRRRGDGRHAGGGRRTRARRRDPAGRPARRRLDGTLLDRPWAEVFTAPNDPHSATSFGAYGPVVRIVNGQWVQSRGGANPGVGALWSIYPYTGSVGVILSNIDGVPLQEMAGQETQAIAGGGTGG